MGKKINCCALINVLTNSDNLYKSLLTLAPDNKSYLSKLPKYLKTLVTWMNTPNLLVWVAVSPVKTKCNLDVVKNNTPHIGTAFLHDNIKKLVIKLITWYLMKYTVNIKRVEKRSWYLDNNGKYEATIWELIVNNKIVDTWHQTTNYVNCKPSIGHKLIKNKIKPAVIKKEKKCILPIKLLVFMNRDMTNLYKYGCND
jgi:hypothetical protein